MSKTTTITKIADLEEDDVITLDGVNYMVIAADPYLDKVKVAAGRTDPGQWINVKDYQNVTMTRFR